MKFTKLLKAEQGAVDIEKLVDSTISSLASSQGFYSRLWRDLREAKANGDDLTDFYAQFADCKDTLDVVMVLEG